VKVNFLKPVANGSLRFEGTVVHRGKTIGLVECNVTDEKGDLVARCSSTCMVLRKGGKNQVPGRS